jgi:hypothetical protein
MIPIQWPPEIDGIKLDKQVILGRVKNTDIWIELNAHLEWLKKTVSKEMQEAIQAWQEAHI